MKNVILAGIAGNISNTTADNEYAVRQISTVLKGNVSASTRLRCRGK